MPQREDKDNRRRRRGFFFWIFLALVFVLLIGIILFVALTRTDPRITKQLKLRMSSAGVTFQPTAQSLRFVHIENARVTSNRLMRLGAQLQQSVNVEVKLQHREGGSIDTQTTTTVLDTGTMSCALFPVKAVPDTHHSLEVTVRDPANGVIYHVLHTGNDPELTITDDEQPHELLLDTHLTEPGERSTKISIEVHDLFLNGDTQNMLVLYLDDDAHTTAIRFSETSIAQTTPTTMLHIYLDPTELRGTITGDLYTGTNFQYVSGFMEAVQNNAGSIVPFEVEVNIDIGSGTIDFLMTFEDLANLFGGNFTAKMFVSENQNLSGPVWPAANWETQSRELFFSQSDLSDSNVTLHYTGASAFVDMESSVADMYLEIQFFNEGATKPRLVMRAGPVHLLNDSIVFTVYQSFNLQFANLVTVNAYLPFLDNIPQGPLMSYDAQVVTSRTMADPLPLYVLGEEDPQTTRRSNEGSLLVNYVIPEPNLMYAVRLWAVPDSAFTMLTEPFEMGTLEIVHISITTEATEETSGWYALRGAPNVTASLLDANDNIVQSKQTTEHGYVVMRETTASVESAVVGDKAIPGNTRGEGTPTWLRLMNSTFNHLVVPPAS